MLGDLTPTRLLARRNDGIFVGESLQPETRDNAGKVHLKNELYFLGNQKPQMSSAGHKIPTFLFHP